MVCGKCVLVSACVRALRTQTHHQTGSKTTICYITLIPISVDWLRAPLELNHNYVIWRSSFFRLGFYLPNECSIAMRWDLDGIECQYWKRFGTAAIK